MNDRTPFFSGEDAFKVSCGTQLNAPVLGFILTGCSGSSPAVTPANFRWCPARLVRLLADCHVELGEEAQKLGPSLGASRLVSGPGENRRHKPGESRRTSPNLSRRSCGGTGYRSRSATSRTQIRTRRCHWDQSARARAELVRGCRWSAVCPATDYGRLVTCVCNKF